MWPLGHRSGLPKISEPAGHRVLGPLAKKVTRHATGHAFKQSPCRCIFPKNWEIKMTIPLIPTPHFVKRLSLRQHWSWICSVLGGFLLSLAAVWAPVGRAQDRAVQYPPADIRYGAQIYAAQRRAAVESESRRRDHRRPDELSGGREAVHRHRLGERHVCVRSLGCVELMSAAIPGTPFS
jgi:hypothetical protein